ncbi:MAG: hypothetical protein ABIH23_10830 [bacterium]
MAIDPTISLANLAQRKPVWDPGATFDRAMSLRDLMDKRRVQEAALKQAEIEQKLQKIELRGERQVRRAVKEGGTPSEISARLMTLPGKAGATRAKQLSDAEASWFDAQTAQLKQEWEQTKAFGSIVGAVVNSDTPERYYGPAVRQAKSLGMIKPEFSEEWNPEVMPELQTAYQSALGAEGQFTQKQKTLDYKRTIAENAPKQLSDWWKTSSQILGTAKDEQEWQTGVGVLTESGIPPHMLKAIGPYSPENRARIESIGMTPQERAAAVKKSESEWTAAASRGEPSAIAYFKQKAAQVGAEASARRAVETETVGPTPLYTGIAPGETIERDENALIGQPEGTANIVKMIADGRMAMPGGFALRSEYWQNILNLAARYEPGFDASQWRVRLDTRVDFSKGKAAAQIRSLNTLIKHLGSLWKSIDTLDNMRFKMGNRFANWLASETGSTALKPYESFSEAVSGETAALLKGSSPSIPEIKAQKELHDVNDAPEAQRAAALATLEVAEGRLSALRGQWKNAFRKVPDFAFIDTVERKILKDILKVDPDLIDPGGAAKGQGEEGAIMDPQGNLTFPDGTIIMKDGTVKFGRSR